MFDELKRYTQRQGYSFKSLVAFAIFGAIILVFALFGAPTRNKSSGSGAAARVNNSLISVADLREESKRLEQMYAPMFGGSGMGDAQRHYLQNMALENLIGREIVAEGAQDNGVAVSDREVAEFITKDIKAFQNEGTFQRDRYQNYLDYMKLSAGEFEQNIRKDRESQRIRRLFEIAAEPLKQEATLDAELKSHKRNVQFIRIDKEAWLQKAAVSDAEIADLKKQPDFEKRADQYFQENRSKYVSPLEVRASHILIKSKPGDAESEKAALAKIEQIRTRAQAEDFAKLAKETSQDFGSQSKGGDLGYFGTGKMDPAFEKAAFDLKKEGEISPPVKSAYGYHIIKLTGRHEAKNPKLDDVKPEITRKLVAMGHFDDLIKKIEEALKASDEKSLEALIKSQGWTWEETGLFDYSQAAVPKLTGNVLTRSVFELSQSHPFSKQVVRENTDKYILKLKEDKVEALPTEKVASMTDPQQREGNYAVFGSWVEQVKAASRIEKNDEIFQARGAE